MGALHPFSIGATLCLAIFLSSRTTTAAPYQPENGGEHGLEPYYTDSSAGCYYNFQHYDEGDRIITNEPCLNCTCHNRMLMCYLRVCPFTKAIGEECTIEKKPDQCCPEITCPDVAVPVLSATTTLAPEESTGLGHPDNYGCSIDEVFYSDGAQVPSNPHKPCELCYCIRNRTACVMQECTLHVEGCRPVYHEGVCCPVRYDCDYEEEHIETTARPTPGLILTTTLQPGASQDCYHNNEVYADGALIQTERPCEHCYCMKGEIVCAVQECGTPLEHVGKNCTALPVKEGQCCPDNYECATESPTDLTTTESYIEEATERKQEEEVTQRQIPEKEVTHEQVPEEEVTQKQVPEEEVTQGQVPEEEVTQGQVPEEEVTQGQVPEEEVTQGQVPQEEVTQGQVSEEEVTQGQIPEKQQPESETELTPKLATELPAITTEIISQQTVGEGEHKVDSTEEIPTKHIPEEKEKTTEEHKPVQEESTQEIPTQETEKTPELEISQPTVTEKTAELETEKMPEEKPEPSETGKTTEQPEQLAETGKSPQEESEQPIEMEKTTEVSAVTMKASEEQGGKPTLTEKTPEVTTELEEPSKVGPKEPEQPVTTETAEDEGIEHPTQTVEITEKQSEKPTGTEKIPEQETEKPVPIDEQPITTEKTVEEKPTEPAQTVETEKSSEMQPELVPTTETIQKQTEEIPQIAERGPEISKTEKYPEQEPSGTDKTLEQAITESELAEGTTLKLDLEGEKKTEHKPTESIYSPGEQTTIPTTEYQVTEERDKIAPEDKTPEGEHTTQYQLVDEENLTEPEQITEHVDITKTTEGEPEKQTEHIPTEEQKTTEVEQKPEQVTSEEETTEKDQIPEKEVTDVPKSTAEEEEVKPTEHEISEPTEKPKTSEIAMGEPTEAQPTEEEKIPEQKPTEESRVPEEEIKPTSVPDKSYREEDGTVEPETGISSIGAEETLPTEGDEVPSKQATEKPDFEHTPREEHTIAPFEPTEPAVTEKATEESATHVEEEPAVTEPVQITEKPEFAPTEGEKHDEITQVPEEIDHKPTDEYQVEITEKKGPEAGPTTESDQQQPEVTEISQITVSQKQDEEIPQTTVSVKQAIPEESTPEGDIQTTEPARYTTAEQQPVTETAGAVEPISSEEPVQITEEPKLPTQEITSQTEVPSVIEEQTPSVTKTETPITSGEEVKPEAGCDSEDCKKDVPPVSTVQPEVSCTSDQCGEEVTPATTEEKVQPEVGCAPGECEKGKAPEPTEEEVQPEAGCAPGECEQEATPVSTEEKVQPEVGCAPGECEKEVTHIPTEKEVKPEAGCAPGECEQEVTPVPTEEKVQPEAGCALGECEKGKEPELTQEKVQPEAGCASGDCEQEVTPVSTEEKVQPEDGCALGECEKGKEPESTQEKVQPEAGCASGDCKQEVTPVSTEQKVQPEVGCAPGGCEKEKAPESTQDKAQPEPSCAPGECETPIPTEEKVKPEEGCAPEECGKDITQAPDSTEESIIHMGTLEPETNEIEADDHKMEATTVKLPEVTKTVETSPKASETVQPEAGVSDQTTEYIPAQHSEIPTISEEKKDEPTEGTVSELPQEPESYEPTTAISDTEKETSPSRDAEKETQSPVEPTQEIVTPPYSPEHTEPEKHEPETTEKSLDATTSKEQKIPEATAAPEEAITPEATMAPEEPVQSVTEPEEEKQPEEPSVTAESIETGTQAHEIEETEGSGDEATKLPKDVQTPEIAPITEQQVPEVTEPTKDEQVTEKTAEIPHKEAETQGPVEQQTTISAETELTQKPETTEVEDQKPELSTEEEKQITQALEPESTTAHHILETTVTLHEDRLSTEQSTEPGQDKQVTEKQIPDEPSTEILPPSEPIEIQTETSTKAIDHEEPTSPLPTVPGEGSCLVEGQTYDNNSLVPSMNPCQSSCHCISSIVQCESVTCLPPPENMENCMPIYHSPHSCCPTYACTGTKATDIESESHVTEPISTSITHETESSVPVEPVESSQETETEKSHRAEEPTTVAVEVSSSESPTPEPETKRTTSAAPEIAEEITTSGLLPEEEEITSKPEGEELPTHFVPEEPKQVTTVPVPSSSQESELTTMPIETSSEEITIAPEQQEILKPHKQEPTTETQPDIQRPEIESTSAPEHTEKTPEDEQVTEPATKKPEEILEEEFTTVKSISQEEHTTQAEIEHITEVKEPEQHELENIPEVQEPEQQTTEPSPSGDKKETIAPEVKLETTTSAVEEEKPSTAVPEEPMAEVTEPSVTQHDLTEAEEPSEENKQLEVTTEREVQHEITETESESSEKPIEVASSEIPEVQQTEQPESEKTTVTSIHKDVITQPPEAEITSASEIPEIVKTDEETTTLFREEEINTVPTIADKVGIPEEELEQETTKPELTTVLQEPEKKITTITPDITTEKQDIQEVESPAHTGAPSSSEVSPAEGEATESYPRTTQPPEEQEQTVTTIIQKEITATFESHVTEPTVSETETEHYTEKTEIEHGITQGEEKPEDESVTEGVQVTEEPKVESIPAKSEAPTEEQVTEIEKEIQTELPKESSVTEPEEKQATEPSVEEHKPTIHEEEPENEIVTISSSTVKYEEELTTPSSEITSEHEEPAIQVTEIPAEEETPVVQDTETPEKPSQVTEHPEVPTTVKQIEISTEGVEHEIEYEVTDIISESSSEPTIETTAAEDKIPEIEETQKPEEEATEDVIKPEITSEHAEVQHTTETKHIFEEEEIMTTAKSFSEEDINEIVPTVPEVMFTTSEHPVPTESIQTERIPEIEISSRSPETTLQPITITSSRPQISEEHLPEMPDYNLPGDDYEEDQSAFGPGTCRYGGKVYVSAQQIPRDDPCDFCFCFRSDIICLQQSCPPPIPGCHEEPIPGFCCPRYECPVSMAVALNLTTTTTTTTTTLPPHFLEHAYSGQAYRQGCQINGQAYRVGEIVRSASGPCLHCTCGGDGQMKCDPKNCSPQPMLQQMIAAAALRRR